MWNQSFTSAPAVSIGGGSGNATSGVAHPSGSFASHARSNSLAASPSAHRRVSGIAQGQLASSPSANPPFSRPFANTAFPGTVVAPRSTAASNTASAPTRSLQRLPLLTSQTPTSIAKLAFPAHTTVFWHRLHKNNARLAPQLDPDYQRVDASTSTAASSANTSQGSQNAWNTAVQHIITTCKQSRIQPPVTEEPQHHLTPFQLLLKDVLFYTSSRHSSPTGDTHTHLIAPVSHADLWLFVVVTDQEEIKASTSASSAGASDTNATGAAAANQEGTSPLHPTLVRRLPANLVKSLQRLSECAITSSGSYPLPVAAPNCIDLKGKRSSLTQDQRQAHRRFMASVKAKLVDALAASQSTSTNPTQSHAMPRRARLRLGRGVVFLPPRPSDSSSIALSDAAWFAAPKQSISFDGRVESDCLMTRFTTLLTTTSLFVYAHSRRFGALPLTDSRYATFLPSLPSSSASPTMLIAPLGYHVELLGIVPTSSVAEEHLSELYSRLATLSAGPIDDTRDISSLFASGLAICALPRSIQRLHDQQPRLPDPLPNEPDIASSQAEATDEVMTPPVAAQGHEQARKGSSQFGPESRHFLWPAAWCLVVPDQSRTLARAAAPDDLQNLQSQPMTPLKELVSFTLKVLNDANESSPVQNASAYTPGEPDDASLAQHRVDLIPSTRPDITPASISFPDFDFAMPTVASATSSQALPPAGHSVAATSPLKREPTNTEPMPGASTTEAFAQDLNWMQFLPSQINEAPASASASALADQSNLTSSSAPGAVDASTQGPGGTQNPQLDQSGTNWLLSTGSASAPLEGGADAATATAAAAPAQAPNLGVPPSLLQPHSAMHSHGATPLQQMDNTPLALTQPTSTKRKAGEGDIFDNLGLLTDDDFSFFDESAFGLHPEAGLPPHHVNQPAEAAQLAPSHDLDYDQRLMSEGNGPGVKATSSAIVDPQPATSSASIVDDVAMDDAGQSSLDALFSAIPGLQHAMASADLSQAQSTAPQATALSAAPMQPAQLRTGASTAPETAAATAGSMHAFHPAMNSFTPRDASVATPFGDPASLPGFTPSSLTESSPTFGNPQYKTPRTPYSPIEEYRDGATIVDLQNDRRMRESAQASRERNATSAPHLYASSQHPVLKRGAEDQLRLADVSTAAAAAAAHAAMDMDLSNRKRPAIVPNAFLPLPQTETRKPLQRLAIGARANLGRKYDLLGKFASRPKPATITNSASNANNVPLPERRLSGDASRAGGRADKEGAAESAQFDKQSLTSHSRPRATRRLPSRTPSGRGLALLQLHRDRQTKASPGSVLTALRHPSSSRTLEAPATPRSSDDLARSGAVSASESDASSSDGNDDSDDARSDTEATALTLSPADQATLKASSLEVISTYLCGATSLSKPPWSPAVSGPIDEASDDVSLPRQSVQPPGLHLCTVPRDSYTDSSAIQRRPTMRRSTLSRTAEWLIQNPQFRSMYGFGMASITTGTDVAVGDKIEVLEAMASVLSIAPASEGSKQPSDTDMDSAAAGNEAQSALPTLKYLVKVTGRATGEVAAAACAADADSGLEIAEVLEPSRIAVGCQGSVVEALPSALTLWDKSKLSAVSGQKHVVAKVLLTDASPAWHEEIVAWLDRVRIAFETHGLGTHIGNAQSILAIADGSETLALSSYLEQLWQDGEAWLDTLRSISNRVQLDLLQGKHVVVYTLQPPNSTVCASAGFHGLLRLEADLRAMLSEQVGVLAEQLLVRAVSPSMMTESGSLGFGQHSQALRTLAFSVYDQLPRLVRRQPAKVLHGKEPGPISALVQFPAFSLSSAFGRASSGTRLAGAAGRTQFSLSWPREPAGVTDEHVLLHVGYRICEAVRGGKAAEARRSDRLSSRNGSAASLAGASISELGHLADDDAPGPAMREKVVMVSAIDERGGSSTVDALAANDGDGSIEACVERVWRFALAEASRAHLHWRLVISSTGLMKQCELRAWQRLIDAYLSSSGAQERVIASVVLLSVRPDESGAVLAERGVGIKARQEWTAASTADKGSLMLLDAADLSQMVCFAEPMPMEWTQASGGWAAIGEEDEDAEQDGDEKEATAMPLASAILVHRTRPDLVGGGGRTSTSSETKHKHCPDGFTPYSHVLAVDMLQVWRLEAAQQTSVQNKEAKEAEEALRSGALDGIMRSLHRLRLISQERHQLPWPYNAQPWCVASVNTLAACLDGIVLRD